MKRIIIGLFFCLIFIQIIVPLSMIVKREKVLNSGQQFKFKTEPVDPYDAFRGRYVALRIKEGAVSVPAGMRLKSGQSIYALIAVDEEGFAKFSAISSNRPQSIPYIQAKISYIRKEKAYLDLPMDRYYMGEKSAPLAEKLYREHSGIQDKQDAYVLARVKDGFAVIEELYVGGKRIEEAVKDVK